MFVHVSLFKQNRVPICEWQPGEGDFSAHCGQVAKLADENADPEVTAKIMTFNRGQHAYHVTKFMADFVQKKKSVQ